MKRMMFAAVLSLLATPALSAELTFKLDPRHTQVLASWTHKGLSHPSANFGQVDGTLVYDTDDVSASSVQVSMPLSGLDTFVPALDEHLRSADFFDAERYPAMTFKSTAVQAAGEGKLKVTGDLTIKDVTRPVVLDVSLNGPAPQAGGQRQAIGFDAVGTLKRSAFGIDKLMSVVDDEIVLRITSEASAPRPDAAK